MYIYSMGIHLCKIYIFVLFLPPKYSNTHAHTHTVTSPPQKKPTHHRAVAEYVTWVFKCLGLGAGGEGAIGWAATAGGEV